MAPPCPQCGAHFASGESCQSRFHACLALEYENPISFGKVHHLMVICYMLQHNLYSHEGWLQARKLLSQFIQEELSPKQARRQQPRLKEGRMTQPPGMKYFDQVTWSSNLAQVRCSDPEIYIRDVTGWAERVLADTDPLIMELSKTS